MAERLKAPVLKTGKGATLSWVQSQSLRHKHFYNLKFLKSKLILLSSNLASVLIPL